MPTITLTLGVRFGEHDANYVKSFSIQGIPTEFTPEQVFHAANRIDETAIDMANLSNAAFKTMRWALDIHNAPSMSAGDYFDVFSDKGVRLGRWLCLRMGWEFVSAQVTP